jgi:methionyl aminopeptidase
MIKKKSEADIVLLREGGARLAKILRKLARAAKSGVSTTALDQMAQELIAEGGDEPSFLNYQPAHAPRPYPAALCVSINDEVVHGIPGERILEKGDIVSLDLGIKHGGLYTDMAITVPVGVTSNEAMNLIAATDEALMAGISAAKAGAHIGDIGAAVESVAKVYGFGVVRDLAGHGVGYAAHEDPLIPNYGKRGEGVELEAGMVLAIEPMLNVGGWRVKFLDDGYTVKTADGSLSAHSERTILVTEDEPEILTQ